MKKIFLLLAVAIASPVFAQVGNDNPTGVSGAFNGNITTGCSYYPYTGNATRVVTDVTVNGAVGTIPLQLTRIYNSRGTAPWNSFGFGSPWQHNYNWNMPGDGAENAGSAPPLPTSYEIDFPDGRIETFAAVQGDTYYRAAPGTRERFVPFSGSLGYLIFQDGSKVEFKAKLNHYLDPDTGITWYSWGFNAQALIDPFGQRTSITYDANGNVSKVTEPAGRYLQFYYVRVGGFLVVDHVTSSDGRSVQYSYVQSTFSPGTTTYTVLDHIVYYGDSQWTATYKYKAPNVGSANGTPLLWKCDDPMYAGPMKRIAYTYATANNADGTAPVYGEILSENYYDGTNIGAAVTTLSVNGSTRTETRGDGPSRTFTYTAYKLTSATDFKAVAASQAYDANGYLNSVTDRNSHTTTFTNNALTGSLTQATYPVTPNDTLPNTPQTVVQYLYLNPNDPPNNDANNPYYLYQFKDGLNHTTTYKRDSNHRITEIDYADGSYETFTYNAFGEVLTHRMRNGGTEASTYDATGNTLDYRDPSHDPINKTGNPTLSCSYDSMNRLANLTEYDHGGTAQTISYTYDARGELTRVTHPDTTYVQRSYNSDGTLAWAADELHPTANTDASQRTTFAYDNFKRVRAVTTPIRFSGDTTNRITSFFYDSAGTGDDYTRTAANITWLLTPNLRQSRATYDANLRMLSVTVAPSTTDQAVTSYSYDNVGNLKTVQNPNQQTGGPNAGTNYTYWYDERNRISDVDDPLSTDRNSANHTVSYKYDAASNRIQRIRADDRVFQRIFDAMNRVTQTVGYGNETTAYQYDIAGNLLQVTDPNNHVYSFSYDQLNRKTGATYPMDANGSSRSESYVYDSANHLYHYVNPAGQTKTFTYDSRDRLTNTSWSSNGPAVTIAYDAASNLTSLTNVAGSDTIIDSFTYDGANNKVFETQNVNGISHIIQTHRDPDGNRSDLFVNTGGTISGNVINGGTMNYGQSYDYTNRNQLLDIYDQTGAPFFKYTYDANGNVTQRTGRQANDPMGLEYDALNRPTLIWQGLSGGTKATAFATSHYDYDKIGNIQDTYRDEQSGKGERFTYDVMNQLIGAVYNANGVQTPTPTNATRTVSYTLDAINRTSMTDNGVVTNYTPDPLNQYTAVGALSLSYDNNFNMTSYTGSTYAYDADSRLTSISANGHSAQFVYDALGRCVKRTIDNVATIFTYDGWTPIIEWDANGNLTASNFYGIGGDEILSRILPNGTQYLYRSDLMGNITFLLQNISNTATGIEKYTYDAFGTPTVTDWSGANSRSSSNYGNRFMFSGREYLNEFGIYDLRNRAYHPQLGRFLQSDPIGFAGRDTNLFRYCGHNPVSGLDPWGLERWGQIVDPTGGQGYPSNPTPPGAPPAPDGRVDFGAPPSGATSPGSDGTQPGASGSSGSGSGGEGSSGSSGSGSGSSGTTPIQSAAAAGWEAYMAQQWNHANETGHYAGMPQVVDGGGSGGGGGVRGGSPSGTPGGIPGGTGTKGPGSGGGGLILTFIRMPTATPPTPEQAAWTDLGRKPTLYAAAVIFGGLALPEAAVLRALAPTLYTQLVTHPAVVSSVTYAVVIANDTVNPEEQLWLPEIIEFERRLIQEEWMHRW